jgi:hypothetical protein
MTKGLHEASKMVELALTSLLLLALIGALAAVGGTDSRRFEAGEWTTRD